MYLYMCIYTYSGVLGCGGELASRKRLFNPPWPVLKAGHPGTPRLIYLACTYYFSVLYVNFHWYMVRFDFVVGENLRMSCLSGPGVIGLVSLVWVLHVYLSGMLSFLPIYFLHS